MRFPALLTTFCALSCSANAGILYSNLGFGGTYSTVSGSLISNTPSFTVAMPFTPSANDTITRIDVALALIFGTNSVDLSLRSDQEGLPDSVIDSWTVSGVPPLGSCCSLTTVTTSHAVTANTQYWIVAAPGAPDTMALWMDSLVNNAIFFAQDSGSAFALISGQQGAFQVIGENAVPEPSAFLMAGLGLVAMGLMRRMA